ncbi:hypothetical protein BH18ACT3_BH18ACT3_04980 [soil metagenome]
MGGDVWGRRFRGGRRVGVAACAFGLRTSGWRAVVAGAVGGLLLASLLFLAYGGATFLLLPLTMAVSARRSGAPGKARTVAAAIGVAVAVTAAFAVAGFWWFAGAAETRLHRLCRPVRMLPMTRDLDDVNDLRDHARSDEPGRLATVARSVVDRLG